MAATPSDYERGLRWFETAIEYARALGAWPPADPMEGFEDKLAYIHRVHAMPHAAKPCRPDLLEIAAAHGWGALPPDPADFVARHLFLPCEDPATGIRLDLIFGLTPFEQTTTERAQPIVIAGVPVRFATPEDLIVHKLVAGRPRDIENAASVALRLWTARWRRGDLHSIEEWALGGRWASAHRPRRAMWVFWWPF